MKNFFKRCLLFFCYCFTAFFSCALQADLSNQWYIQVAGTGPITGSRSDPVIITNTNNPVEQLSIDLNAAIPVGSVVRGVAVTPDRKTAYFTFGGPNVGDGGIVRVDLSSNTVMTPPITNPSLRFPYGIAISPDGAFAYVTNFNPLFTNVENLVVQINLASQSVSAVYSLTTDDLRLVRDPIDLAVTHDGNYVVVTTIGDFTGVWVIDVKAGTNKEFYSFSDVDFIRPVTIGIHNHYDTNVNPPVVTSSTAYIFGGQIEEGAFQVLSYFDVTNPGNGAQSIVNLPLQINGENIPSNLILNPALTIAEHIPPFVSNVPYVPYLYISYPGSTNNYVIPMDLSTNTVQTANAVNIGPIATSISTDIVLAPDQSAAYVVLGNAGVGNTSLATLNITNPAFPSLVSTVSLLNITAPFPRAVVLPDQAPIAVSTNPSPVNALTSVLFNAAGSFSPVIPAGAPLNGIVNYNWDFGDGSPIVNTSSPFVSHSYSTGGTFFVTLTVTNAAQTSLGQVFTGQVVTNQGGPSARLIFPITVIGVGIPQKFRGHQEINKFASQTERVNILKWSAPVNTLSVAYYEIYRDPALTDLIAVVSSTDPLRYADHNRRPGETEVYYLIAVGVNGLKSPVAVTVVKPR